MKRYFREPQNMGLKVEWKFSTLIIVGEDKACSKIKAKQKKTRNEHVKCVTSLKSNHPLQSYLGRISEP